MAMKAAILGHGVVGSGVAEILLQQQDCIEAQCGEKVELAYILDVRSFPQLSYAEKFVTDIQVILQDPEVKVVAECIGGASIAFELVAACLKAKKNVCTSNKELIAVRGNELFALARENGVHMLYEACVGGGIPVLRPLQTCFGANRILSVQGILNGTTNYIFGQMEENGSSMEDALAQAQKNGYAEANPAADIEGWDAARKISILASMVSGKYVSPDKVATEGIKNVAPIDMEYAREFGCSVKLIAEANFAEDGISVCVAPAFVPKSRLLAHVNGVQNAVCIRGDMVGETVFYGPGAGKLPTASAVVSDLITLTSLGAQEQKLMWSPEPAALAKTPNQGDFYVRFSGEKGALPLSSFEKVTFLSDPENQSVCAVVVEETDEQALRRALQDCSVGLIARVLKG